MAKSKRARARERKCKTKNKDEPLTLQAKASLLGVPLTCLHCKFFGAKRTPGVYTEDLYGRKDYIAERGIYMRCSRKLWDSQRLTDSNQILPSLFKARSCKEFKQRN